MAKQIHIRLEDTLYEALATYTEISGQSVQDFVAGAVMQMLKKKKTSDTTQGTLFSFIDLYFVSGIHVPGFCAQFSLTFR